MSIQFNDTTTYKGLVQIYEKEIGVNRTDISGNSDKLKEYTAEANIADDDFKRMAIKASGTWQYDDSNHTDYPIITTNLVDGQRDYSFTTDGSSNLILDIHKVYARIDSTGVFQELHPVDVQSEWTDDFTNGDNIEGVPYEYDKTANGIFLNPIPSYNSTGGLKIYISREGSYFTSADTTKKPGVPGLFHRYYAIKPAMHYARRNNLSSYDRLLFEVQTMEAQINEYFGNRERDKRKVMRNKKFNYR